MVQCTSFPALTKAGYNAYFTFLFLSRFEDPCFVQMSVVEKLCTNMGIGFRWIVWFFVVVVLNYGS